MPQIDPVTRDYVVVNGSPIEPDRILEACYYALVIPQGAWLHGNPEQGSLLWTLANSKRNGNVEQQFSSFAQEAIKRQVIATGKATAQQLKNIQATRSGTNNQIEVIPAQTQLSQQLNFVPV